MEIMPEDRDNPEEDEQFIFEKQNINLQTNSELDPMEAFYLQKLVDFRQRVKL